MRLMAAVEPCVIVMVAVITFVGISTANTSASDTDTGRSVDQPALVPPEFMSPSEIDQIPVGATRLVLASPAADSPREARASLVPGYDCELHAIDPYLQAPLGRRKFAYGVGWNQCAIGINQRTKICLYKEHHFLFTSYFKEEVCRSYYNRYPTFRPASVPHLCDHDGSGRWRTVIFGSVYMNGPEGPGVYAGQAESHDKTFSLCN